MRGVAKAVLAAVGMLSAAPVLAADLADEEASARAHSRARAPFDLAFRVHRLRLGDEPDRERGHQAISVDAFLREFRRHPRSLPRRVHGEPHRAQRYVHRRFDFIWSRVGTDLTFK